MTSLNKPKIMFDAYQVYSYGQIVSCFIDFNLHKFSLIPDNSFETGIIENAKQELADTQTYACGCFRF